MSCRKVTVEHKLSTYLGARIGQSRNGASAGAAVCIT